MGFKRYTFVKLSSISILLGYPAGILKKRAIQLLHCFLKKQEL